MAGPSVVKYKVESRCKFCVSEHRDEIDFLLFKRSTGVTDAAGKRLNMERVLEAITSLGVLNPTPENIKNHWNGDETKAHSYFNVPEKEKGTKPSRNTTREQKRRRTLIEKILPGWLDEPYTLSPDQVATISQTLGLHDAIHKFVTGEKSGFTVDHGLKGGHLATQRNVNDATVKLMEFAGMAIGSSIQGQMAKGDSLKELGPVDHEIVEGKSGDKSSS